MTQSTLPSRNKIARENGMLGLRLAKSAHIGHLFGSIYPAKDEKHKRNIFVILADLFTFTSGRADNITKENLIAITADCISAGLDGENIKFCIQSRTIKALSPLIVICNSLISYYQLTQIQPIKSLLADEAKTISFSDIAFPIIQSAEMIASRSSTLYSNVDNLGIVSLAARISKAIALTTKLSMPVPRLKHGLLPMLRGTDRRKMSYGNQNAISVLDTPEAIERKISRLRTDPVEALSDPTVPADLTLVFEYCSVFGFTADEIYQFKSDYDKGKTTALKIKLNLCKKIQNHLLPLKQKREVLIKDEHDKIWERIKEDTSETKKMLKRNTYEITEAFGFKF